MKMGSVVGGAAAMTYRPSLPQVVSPPGRPRPNPASKPSAIPPSTFRRSRFPTVNTQPRTPEAHRRAGTNDKQLKILPGSWHGWEIVEEAPYASRARKTILDWIRNPNE